MEKVIIITGASRGIGKCIAETLARENNKIIANYNKSEMEAINLQKELQEQGIRIEIFKANISNKEEAKNLINFTIKKYGKIDCLINNAAIDMVKPFLDIKESEWKEIINTNLNSVFYTSQETLKYMLDKKQGCIINISSIWGLIGASCESVYSVSKAGVDALTKSLAKEFGPSNIRINSIAPGIIDTQMNEFLDDEEKKEIINHIPLQKIGKPIDISRCIKWLIEDEYTTGQIIEINGGWHI